jgi:hypothetical protein
MSAGVARETAGVAKETAGVAKETAGVARESSRWVMLAQTAPAWRRTL